MINVYWGDEYIDGILDVLDEKNVKTTFFLGGMWVLENEKTVKKIIERGHEGANHGYKHKSQDKISEKESCDEIKTTHDLIKSLSGVDMTLFAPPSGAFNNQTIENAKKLGYKVVMWTRDTIDWRDKNTELIYNRAISNLHGGDLILMHPTKNTLEALPKIIDYVQAKGFNPTTVTKTLNEA